MSKNRDSGAEPDLTRAVAFTLIGVSTLVLVITLLLLAVPSLRALVVEEPPPPGYSVGRRIDLPASLFGESARTVLIFARDSCVSCQAAKPLLTQVVASARQAESRVSIVMTDREPEGGREFAKAIGLHVDELVLMEVSKLGLERVPAIVVVDRSGTILSSQSGLLSGSAADLVVSALRDGQVP